MGTAALTGRIARRNGAPSVDTPAAEGLVFDSTGGPVVAVCGLVGGAGTTTLAFLLAREAARRSSVPVLLAELRDCGALAALAGAGADHGLAALAAAVENDQPVAAPFTDPAGGPRLAAATRPALGPGPPVTSDGLRRLLGDASAAHGLVVVDAGRVGDPLHAALFDASEHALFVTAATATALAHTKRLAQSGLFSRTSATRASLVAVATESARAVSPKRLRQLADGQTERLLLVPHIGALANGRPDQASAQLQATGAALASLLRSAR